MNHDVKRLNIIVLLLCIITGCLTGCGNPNWINTQSRYAFTRFMDWAISESELTFQEGNMAGQAKKENIGERFAAAMESKTRYLIQFNDCLLRGVA